MRTNEQRAARFLKALEAYKAAEGETIGPDISEDIVDLLVDLHHYTMSESKFNLSPGDVGLAVDSMVVGAFNHFEAEQDD